MGVDPVVHIDPVYPDNPMVQKVKKELDLISSNDDRIINTHDIRIVNTDNHNLILFGVNIPSKMTRDDILKLNSSLQKKLAIVFNAYEIKAKISPIYKN